MATLDQLSADKRAILELVLQRGQSYEDIADMLGMPAARVREHARDALVSLAPRTADRVDSDWQGQLADYVLGQQSGPESKATRSHLKRSEPARAWALSMLDSLGDLYENGAEPEIPSAEPAGRRSRRSETAAAAMPSAAKPERRTKPAAERPRRREPEPKRERPRAAPAGALSPEAERVVRRRRVLGAAAGLIGLVAVVLFALLVWPFGGDDEAPEPAADTAGSTPAAETQVLGQIELEPQGGERGGGIAYIAQQGDQRQLIVQARLEPSTENAAYEVWLYNSDEDAQSIGAQFTDEQGLFVGAGILPEDFERYEFIDVSREEMDQNPEHSGESVLRGQIAGGEPAPEAGGAAPPGTEPPPSGGAPVLPPGGEPAPPQEGVQPAPEGGSGQGGGGGGSGGGGGR